MTTAIDPLALFEQPATLGRLGAKARAEAFNDEIWVRPAPAHDAPPVAALVRDNEPVALAAWPEPQALRAGDRVIISVGAEAADRRRYVAWLRAMATAAPTEVSVAPTSEDDSGMHRLWCIAAARVVLPAKTRVEARHDLVGIRLAQLAVGFGADTLAGPIEADRVLPLAGVTRPTEATPKGLATLIEQVGLRPRVDTPPPPTAEGSVQ